MSDFDHKARDWDKDSMHVERANAIAAEIVKMVPLNGSMRAMEYGAGTGLLSFALKDRFSEIVLMDSSAEMIAVCKEKTEFFHTKHIKPLLFDLENSDYNGKFDFICNQMVMHHVNNVDLILNKFYSLLNPGGYLSIADLYAEDGSFHGKDVSVIKGFDMEHLTNKLKNIGFREIKHKQSYSIKKQTESGVKDFPVFLLSALRS